MILKGGFGSIVGHNHVSLHQQEASPRAPLIISSLNNRQDMIATHFVHASVGTEVAFAVFDGSSDAASSEVGAGIFAQLSVVKLAQLVQMYGIESPLLAAEMTTWFLSRMKNIVGLHPYGDHYLATLDLSRGGKEMNTETDLRLSHVYNWIRSNFLFCVLLGYVSPKGVVILQRGDGGYQIDDSVITQSFDDVPPYFGYELYPASKLQAGTAELVAQGKTVTRIPPGFTSVFSPSPKRVALFSDGFPIKRLPDVWDLLIPVDRWGAYRNKLEARIRGWWREYKDPDNPGEGWLVADDLSLIAFCYED